ncbi:MAG: putative selenium-dependent hydroxylase accessory protein YqeC [Spirochaetaceae bacterium]|jgi:probable selenium-dependent hydroxylase accessory protein YqeC|nr:putative selenium-dependent hydroxylase accessory protein YqeC [Spirochaetaceae bacterium]
MLLTGFFDDFGKNVVTIIGSGGKTSLLWKLAGQKRNQKTLVATTVRIACPNAAADMYDYLLSSGEPFSPVKRGITLAGNTTTDAKFRSLSIDELEKIIPFFEYTFIEGDGSRMLPLKAWTDYEPVITLSTTITVGVLPLWPLGLEINERIIHRLPLFTSLTGGQYGDKLTLNHLLHIITGNTGLFKNAQGKKILFFNQTEDDNALQNAYDLARLLPPKFKENLAAIIAGSVHKNYAERIQ